MRNYSSFSLKTGIQCRLLMNKHWGLNMQKEAFLTLDGSNLQHLINSHLRDSLQAIIVYWQHISPCWRWHIYHALRGTSVAAPAEAATQEPTARLAVLVPDLVQHGHSASIQNRWSPAMEVVSPLPKSGLRFGTEWLLHCLDVGHILTWTWKTAVCRVFSGHWLEM